MSHYFVFLLIRNINLNLYCMKATMKRFKLVSVIVIAATLFTVTGCDFFRSLVGKPTSKDIERMKIEAAEQQRLKKQQDSIVKAQAVQLEQEKAAAAAKKYLLDESAGKFHVIMGSYRIPENAQKMFATLEKNGYAPRYVLFSNGFSAVSIAGYDNYHDALKAMRDAMELPYCPEDVWVYGVAQNLHRTDYQNFSF